MGDDMSVGKTLEERAAFEDFLITISTGFIDLPIERIDREITRALEAIGRFTDVDRSYVFFLSPDGASMDNTHEWCAPGIEPQIDSLQHIPTHRFPWWMKRILGLEVIYIPSVAALPAEASAEKEILLAQRIRSLVVVPIMPSGTAVGFFGFDSVRAEKMWPDETIRLLEKTGNIIARALERRRMEKTLRDSEERHWLALSGADIGMWDWNVRTGDLFFNRQWAAMLGYEGDKIEKHVRSWMQMIHPDDFRRFMQELNDHLEDRTPCFESEYRLRTRSGDWIWVLDRGRVVEKSGSGKALRMTGTRLESTRRKLTEIALRISEKRYRTVVEGLSDPVCRFRPDMTITFVNQAFCRCFGKKPEKLIGENLLLLVPENDWKEAEAFFARFDRDRPMATTEYRMQTADGKARWMQWVNRATFDENGGIDEFQAVGRDVTSWIDQQTP
ncbi:MAG: PAS domain-containing protein [Pirellulales bacterium]|nr:PAS domain-containing protein [Pirellulales bacterium]